MSELDYHAIGHQPDVAEGEHHVHVTALGSWTPLFSLSPDEALLFAGRIKRAAARIREAEKHPRVTRGERDEHLHLLSVAEMPSARRVDPFTYAPPVLRPRVWQQRLAAGIFVLGLVVIGLGLISLLGGAGL